MIAPIKHIQPIQRVLTRVAVHDVEEHNNVHRVGRVDELFQIFGRAVSRGGGEEVVDLVAEGGVVGVLHDGHQLDHVIAAVCNPGQRVPRELLVAGDFRLRTRDAHMGLIDTG